MSQWKYKLEGEEHGPVSFAELAELVRQGAVTDTTQVCRVGSAHWESAWRVPMLAAEVERATQKSEVGNRRSEIGDPGAQSPIRDPQSAIRNSGALTTSATWRRWLVPVAAGALAMLACYYAARQAMRFPPSRFGGGPQGDYYFVFFGRCNVWECALLYFDVFAVAAALAWWLGKKVG